MSFQSTTSAVPYLAIGASCRRLIVCGDIHGCWQEFQGLLAKLDFGPDDFLITVGDFLDRGPDSWKVAEFFRSTPNARSALGNHERRVMRVVRGTSKPAWSQRQSLSLLAPEAQQEWAAWLETLPAVIETPLAIVTHARLDPRLPLAAQDPYFTAAVGGASIEIERDHQGVPVWFSQMRCDKPFCIGHIRYDRVVLVSKGLYALDTDAVRGGMLTAVTFPDGAIHQVPVHRNHYEDSLLAWKKQQLLEPGPPASWPLSHIVQVLDEGMPADEELCQIIQPLHAFVEELRLSEKGPHFQSRLLARFGPLPPPGPSRGEYFMKVKAAFPERGFQGLAAHLLRGNPLGTRDLAHYFPKAILSEVEGIFQKLI
ncbi:MAG: metallophosphoesterase [Verrucomicrobia bacterium]|nr:metallophosphoesterase [Verrucomicrobiota bacterium]